MIFWDYVVQISEEVPALNLARRCATFSTRLSMGCFSRWRPQQRLDEETDLVRKSLELMRSSQSVSLFPGLRRIHAGGSTRESLQVAATSKVYPCSVSDTGRSTRGSSGSWEPLYILIEKGKFSGKPLPLPEPPQWEEDENFLVPPLMPKAALDISTVPASPEVWGMKLKCFRFDEVAAACEDFSSRCCIREGSFGKVYKCIMHVRSAKSIGKRKLEVAVFRLPCSVQEVEDWIASVKWIARLQHANLCKLIGFCASGRRKDGRAERLLVFEHCDYGGLDVLLAKSQYIRPLNWPTRLRIALGAAKGLSYLHEHQVVYSNLTSANILIDKDFNAKLSDYGLNVAVVTHLSAKMPDDEAAYIRNDVRNFGVVLMELLVGTKNMRRLVEKGGQWISRLLRDEDKLHCNVDSELRNEPLALLSMKELASLALRCLRKDSQLRPNMSQVVEQLHQLIHCQAEIILSD